MAGLDDLRPFLFANRRPIPCYAFPETAEVLRRTHGYIFEDGSYPGVPRLELREIDGPFEVVSRDDPDRRIAVDPVPAWHADLRVAVPRIGRFAYATDVNRLTDDAIERLRGLDVLVLDALRHEPHPAHFTIGEAVRAAVEIGAGRTVLIHMTHTVLHADETAALPDGIELGYDGQVLTARAMG